MPQSQKMQEVLTLLTGTFFLSYNSNPLESDFVINPQETIEHNLSSLDVYFPIDKLLELNARGDIINFVRTLYPTVTNMGIVTSQGDVTQQSDMVKDAFKIWHNDQVFPVNGTGVKVGVLSDSYDKQPYTGASKATVDVLNGDLPGEGNPNGFITPVEVLKDYPFGVASDEGRAMLQIIHDVAPGAQLAFHTGVVSPRDFELGVQALASTNCDVIVDDITFITEPFFGNGRIAQAIEQFTQQTGKMYVTSAGNFSNNGYQSNFSASLTQPTTNFLAPNSGVRAHVFGTNQDGTQDILQKFNVVPGVYMLVLQWDESMASQENMTGASTDLDVYVVTDNGELLVGNNRINIGGDPTEIIVFEATAEAQANIMITSANGNPPSGLSFRYVAFRSSGLDILEYFGAPTVTGHAMSSEVVSVAAVDYRNGENPTPQAYSSYGGMLSNQQLIQIDLAAPDGVNTNVGSIGIDNSDEDSFPNFYGTSAAAPHAAAAFALMKSALPFWYPDGISNGSQTTASEILQLFTSTARPGGMNEVVGSGLLDANAAFKQIAAQTPKLITLIVEEGVTPSAEPFEVTIIGAYFPENPKVIFNGEELEIVSVSETEIVAKVGTFSGNPALTVVTDSMSPGGADGGSSNPLYFFDGDKIAINIIANSLEVLFGQDIVFDFTVEGLPEGTTIDMVNLPNVVINSTASILMPYPDVNNYVIEADFESPLTEEQLEQFQVNFSKGVLTVSKNELLITPQPIHIGYGDPFTVAHSYTFPLDGIGDIDQFRESIAQSYGASFYSANALVVINRFAAVVNGQDIMEVLENSSWSVSDNTITNRFNAVVNGMNIGELDNSHFEDYLNSLGTVENNRFAAVVNRFIAIVKTIDLLDGNIDLYDESFENRFNAVVNSSDLGGADDKNDYSEIFSVIDVLDGSDDTGVTQLYAMNVVTGLTANKQGDTHRVFPGAFLSAMASNFSITYQMGTLTVDPGILNVSTQDMVINQGVEPNTDLLVTDITGFVNDENLETVFPNGVSYRFINESGKEYEVGDLGAFYIVIENPENYSINYIRQGMLYVNPYGEALSKLRTYLDCVGDNADDPDGLYFVANFRYENPNPYTIYVPHGPDNFISGEAQFSGETPIVFQPGSGIFAIRFDGKRMTWSLTTMESTHKTSVSSDASVDSNRCGSKEIEESTTTLFSRTLTEGVASVDKQIQGYVSQTNTLNVGEVSYRIFPNPVSHLLSVYKKMPEQGDVVEIYDISGKMIYSKEYKIQSQTHTVDVGHYPRGIYLVRIRNAQETDVKIIRMIKQ